MSTRQIYRDRDRSRRRVVIMAEPPAEPTPTPVHPDVGAEKPLPPEREL